MIAIFSEYPDGERGEFNKKLFTFTGECESVNRGYSLSPTRHPDSELVKVNVIYIFRYIRSRSPFTRGGGATRSHFHPAVHITRKETRDEPLRRAISRVG